MKKEMKWGLATLILLLGIAAVFLLTDKDTATKPKMTLGQPTKDLLKQGVKSPQQAETLVAVNEQEVDTSHPDYHVHPDGTLHIGTHDAHAPVQVAPDAPAKIIPQKDLNIVIPKREDFKTDEEYIKVLDKTVQELNNKAKSLIRTAPRTAIKLFYISDDLIEESRAIKNSIWEKVRQQYPMNAAPPINAANPLIDKQPENNEETE